MRTQTPGATLRIGRAAVDITQGELARRSGVSRWRIIEAEGDHIRLRDDEIEAISKVFRGIVQKVSVPDTVAKRSDDKIQRAFDAVDAALAASPSDAQRTEIAASVLRLRRALGLDDVPFGRR